MLFVPFGTETRAKLAKLEDVRNEFVLQRNYKEQGKHEEKKLQYKQDDEKVKVGHEAAMINWFRELSRLQAPQVQKHLLLRLLLNSLGDTSSCSRVLSIRLLDNELVQRSEKELGHELINIRQLLSEFVNQSAKALEGSEDEKRKLDDVRKKLKEARAELNEKFLSIEHLWRELGHLFCNISPEKRTFHVSRIPQFAAQHLLDGFCIELLNGDSSR